MVVLAIMGVIMAFSIPSYLNYAATQNLIGTASSIAGQMRLAREKAIATGQPQNIHFALNYQNSDYHIHNGTVVGPKWDLPRKIVYYTGFGTEDQFEFTPDGRCEDSGLIIVQDHRGLRDTVSVQRSGFILHQ
jgi:type II secretory pathway pseudopilin PulG